MNFENARFNMIEQQIKPCNIQNNKLIDLLFTLKREQFVSDKYKLMAFADLEIPLPGLGKMLPPILEVKLIDSLNIQKKDKVLEIGSGSGYVTAILAKLCEFVYAVEVNDINLKFATTNLITAGIRNASIVKGNGLDGLISKAPFDKIFIGGGLLEIPNNLKSQLKIGGKLISIAGETPNMKAILIERLTENDYKQSKLFETQTPYLIGQHVNSFKF